MNSPFPPMPNLPGTPTGSASPFSRYGFLAQGRQLSPEEQQRQSANRLAQSIMGQPAQNVAQGAGQMIAGAGMGLRNFMDKPENQFPTAPGGMAPSFGARLANVLGFGPKGGMY